MTTVTTRSYCCETRVPGQAKLAIDRETERDRRTDMKGYTRCKEGVINNHKKE